MNDSQMWVQHVFFCKEIMQHVVPRLSLADIMIFSATCRTMRHKWCGTIGDAKDWVGLLNMRARISERFGINYKAPEPGRKGANPFRYLVRAALKAREKPLSLSQVVRCFGGCGKQFDGTRLVNREWFRYNCCVDCFKKRCGSRYYYIAATPNTMDVTINRLFDSRLKRVQHPSFTPAIRALWLKRVAQIGTFPVKERYLRWSTFGKSLTALTHSSQSGFIYPRKQFRIIVQGVLAHFFALDEVVLAVAAEAEAAEAESNTTSTKSGTKIRIPLLL